MFTHKVTLERCLASASSILKLDHCAPEFLVFAFETHARLERLLDGIDMDRLRVVIYILALLVALILGREDLTQVLQCQSAKLLQVQNQ